MPYSQDMADLYQAIYRLAVAWMQCPRWRVIKRARLGREHRRLLAEYDSRGGWWE